MKQFMRAVGVGLLAFLLTSVVVWNTAPLQAQETISAQFRFTVNVLNRLLIGLRTVTTTLDQDYTQLFSSGTGANQGNALYQTSATLAASATTTYDLNGSLTDDFGQSVTCTKLRAVVVKASSSNTNSVVVGGGSTTVTALTTTGAFTSAGMPIRPGGVWFMTFPDSTGGAVTAGSSDILQIANSAAGSSVTYDFIVVCAE